LALPIGWILLTQSSVAALADDTTAAPTATIERFVSTLNAHDMVSFAALFDDGYVNHQSSAAAPLPPPGRTDKQNSLAFFQARLAGLPDLQVSIEAIVAADDKVAVSLVWQGTQTAAYLGVAPTGRKLRFTSCDIFRLHAGRLIEHWGMGDIAGTLAQLKS
jgi:predicted ester cyclase